MDRTYIQSQQELEEQLKEQEAALQASCASFDQGNSWEAKRLATAVRVLLHDYKSSHSLLGMLNRKEAMLWYDTSISFDPENIMSHIGIVGMFMPPHGKGEFYAPLDFLPPEFPARHVSFSEWWGKVIFSDDQKRTITRSDLILNVADTDGGAHVDLRLAETYAALSRLNSLGWMWNSKLGEGPVEGPEKAAVRQIAHEVLKSLHPEMPDAKPTEKDGLWAFGMSAKVTDTPPAHPDVPKVGRNDPCPCGSGKKYKRCFLALQQAQRMAHSLHCRYF